MTVNPEAVASVSILPTRVPLQVGQTAELITTVVGSRGTNLSGRSVTWRTTNAQIASVSPAGVVTAVAEGSATVTATTGGVSGQAAVIVTAPDPGVTRPLLDDETVVSSIRATVSGFVSNLNDALQSRTMEDIRSAYGVALPASDGDYWQTLVQTGDFRDFEVEMLRMFEPESMGDRWRADFDVTLRFRASRGNEETQIAFRSEFLTASGSVEIATLRMRAQQE